MSLDTATFMEELSNAIVEHQFFTLEDSKPAIIKKAVINYTQNIISLAFSDKTEFNIIIKEKG